MSHSKFKHVLLVISLLLFSGSLAAQNKVVVIPLAGDDLQPLAKVISVAQENGDFSDPLAAVNSITNSSSLNPYIVVIAPGNYTINQPMELPPYVHLAGSGTNQTRLTISGGSSLLDESAALLTLNPRTQVSGLTLTMTAINANSIGIYATTNSYAIIDDVLVSGGSNAGTLSTIGIYDDEGELTIRDSQVVISSTVATNRIYTGLQIYRSNTRANNLNIRVRSTSGGFMTGVLVESLSSERPILANSEITATQTGGGNVNGVINQSTSRALAIQNSTILVSATSSPRVSVDGGLIITGSLIRGHALGVNSGSLRCIGSGVSGRLSTSSATTTEALDLNCNEI